MAGNASREKARIVQLLLDIADSTQSTITDVLAEFDAPASAAESLRILASQPAPITLRELAEQLERDPSTASLIADKFERAGLIERRPHPSDGRKRVLVLTDRGHQLWRAMRDRLHESAMFDHISSGERRVLVDLLDRIHAGQRAR